MIVLLVLGDPGKIHKVLNVASEVCFEGRM
jgi:hypothetical protein